MDLSEYKQKLKAVIESRDAAAQGVWTASEHEYSDGKKIHQVKCWVEGCVGSIDLYHHEDAEFIVLAANNFKAICEAQLKLIEALEVYEDADFYKLGSGIPSFSIEFGELIDHSESSIAACEDTGEVARQALADLVKGQR